MERNIRTYLFQKGQYGNERFGKAHCLIIVHSGINKNLSNEAIFDSYDLWMKGMENQYLFNLQCFKHDGELWQVFYNHLSELL